MSEEMTPRQRWLALLNREDYDRIPTDYWATNEVTERLLKDLGCKDQFEMYDKLHIDGVYTIGAPYTGGPNPKVPEGSIWGVRMQKVDYGSGAYSEVARPYPLEDCKTVADVEAFPWPDGANHDFDAFAKNLAELDDRRAVRCGQYEPFNLYTKMRGMEQAYMDLAVEKDIAHAILTKIFDFHYAVMKGMFEAGGGRVDLTYVAEDLGSQTSLLMSKEMIHEFILPNQKKMADMAKSYGIHVFYHTDGAAREIIPDLIDVTGIEVLNPIQWRCPGMEREGLVKDFGDKIAFHGSIDNQQTLPFGTPDDVRQEVIESVEIYKPARWICAPCHNLQPVSSTENIVTMFETIYEHGKRS
jgi:uroporphyrinogen decarboxylase